MSTSTKDNLISGSLRATDDALRYLGEIGSRYPLDADAFKRLDRQRVSLGELIDNGSMPELVITSDTLALCTQIISFLETVRDGLEDWLSAEALHEKDSRSLSVAIGALHTLEDQLGGRRNILDARLGELRVATEAG